MRVPLPARTTSAGCNTSGQVYPYTTDNYASPMVGQQGSAMREISAAVTGSPDVLETGTGGLKEFTTIASPLALKVSPRYVYIVLHKKNITLAAIA